MKFLFASDSFKGTLSSERITALLEESAKAAVVNIKSFFEP